MFNFYAQISAPQKAITGLLSSLAALTRLNRTQVRIFTADDGWNDWGV